MMNAKAEKIRRAHAAEERAAAREETEGHASDFGVDAEAPPSNVVSVRLPGSAYEQVRVLSATQHTTISALVRRWVVERLNDEQPPLTRSEVEEISRRIAREELAAR